ncbi:hypothetical protein MRO55_24510, partial [Escherichia coli]|uniref:hypothetical protein n=1 Tax=Escherichia coli TaxID=562 RepID=UPI002115C32F
MSDAARREPAHPYPRIVGLRTKENPASALRWARYRSTWIPRGPPAQDLGFGERRRPELDAIPVPALHLVRAFEACGG